VLGMPTWDECYEAIRQAYSKSLMLLRDRTDWGDPDSVRRYHRLARELRKLRMEDEAALRQSAETTGEGVEVW